MSNSNNMGDDRTAGEAVPEAFFTLSVNDATPAEAASALGSKLPNGKAEPGTDPAPVLVRLEKSMTFCNGITIICGVIIGSGVFTSPTSVNSVMNYFTGSTIGLSLVMIWACWATYAGISMFGALCYCFEELNTMSTMYSSNYGYIFKAFGGLPAFLLFWGTFFIRLTSQVTVVALSYAFYIYTGDSDLPREAFSILAAICITVCNCLKPGDRIKQLRKRSSRKVRLETFDLKKCKEELERLDKKLDTLGKSLPPDHEMIADLQQEFEQKSDQVIKKVEEQKEQVEEQKKEVEERLKAAEEESNTREHEIQKVKEQRQELEEKLKAVEEEKGNEIQKVKEQRQELEEQMQDLKNQKQEAEERLKAAEEERNIKGNEIEKVKEQRQELEEQMQDLKNQKQEAEERLKAAEEERNIKGNEIRKVKEQIQDLESQKQKVEERLKAAEEAEHFAKYEIQALQREVDEKVKEIKERNKTEKALQQERDQLKEGIWKEAEYNDLLKKRGDNLERTNRLLKNELEKLESDLAHAKHEMRLLKNDIDNKDKQVKDTVKKVREAAGRNN